MKYITPYDNFITESEVSRITTDHVIPGATKGAATAEPKKPKTEAQDDDEVRRLAKRKQEQK